VREIETLAGERVLAARVPAAEGRRVRVMGWVQRVRDLGAVVFVVLRDRSGTVQAVAADETARAAVRALHPESVVAVEGLAAREPRAPMGVEVRVEAVQVLNPAETGLPFELHQPEVRAGLDVLLDHRALALRHPRLAGIFRVRAALVEGFREALLEEDFVEVHTPKLVGSATEGGAELFSLDYFGRPAYLAQSPQLYKEMLVGAGFERVFEVGPVYRAESHDTARHLNEYTSLDLEVGFIEAAEDVMRLQERVLARMFARVRSRCPDVLEAWGASLPDLGDGSGRPVPRLTLAEAAERLEAITGHRPADGLDPEAERRLGRWAREALGSELLFITHWPARLRPFYAMPDPADPALTQTFDLLYRGLEVTTGGQRLHDHRRLVENLAARGLDPAAFAAYLEPFRFGMPPHGGLAIGLERLTARLLGLGNVREASLFPRDRNRLFP